MDVIQVNQSPLVSNKKEDCVKKLKLAFINMPKWKSRKKMIDLVNSVKEKKKGPEPNHSQRKDLYSAWEVQSKQVQSKEGDGSSNSKHTTE